MNREKIEDCLRVFSFPALPDFSTLRKRYRELIKLYHPDRNPDHVQAATYRVQELNRAYRTLLESVKAVRREPMPRESPAELMRRADQSLSQAVAAGWLKRPPRYPRSRQMRAEVGTVAELLREQEDPTAKNGRRLDFLHALLVVFLRCTEAEAPRPFTAALNVTRHFQRLSRANGLLDTGVRAFYRYQESGRLGRLSAIPLAALEEAERQFRALLWESREQVDTRHLLPRLELTRLFQTRIRSPELAVPWSGI